MLWISAFVLLAALSSPSYQLAAQSPVFLLNGPLYVDTEPRLCCSLPSLPPRRLFFFLLTLTMSPDSGGDVTPGQMSLPAVLHSAGSLLELRGNRWGAEGRCSLGHQVCSRKHRKRRSDQMSEISGSEQT